MDELCAVWFSTFFKIAFMFSRRKKLIQVYGINIKHYDRIDRQMAECLFLMLKQQYTKREKNSLLLTEKNLNTVALIGINL